MKRLVIPSSLNEAVKVQQAILAEAEKSGYSDSARFAIRLALDEALSNAINHGNAGDEKKRVTVEYDITEEKACISVGDEGPGFRPEKLPDPTADENLERPHGRGVMLMKAYMTGVCFNKRGNVVTLTKDRCCKLPER